jgi:hypothetical protein
MGIDEAAEERVPVVVLVVEESAATMQPATDDWTPTTQPTTQPTTRPNDVG